MKLLAERYGPEGSFWTGHPGLHSYLAPVYWEIWNEENAEENADYGTKEIDPARYGTLLEISNHALNEVNPAIQVLFGGLLTGKRNHRKPPESHMAVGAYIHAVKHFKEYDALSLHPYAFKGSVSSVTSKVERNIELARKALKENGVGGKEIWVTEIGWPVDSEGVEHDGVHPPVSESVQRERLTSVFDMIKERSGGPHPLNVGSIMWYEIRDFISGNATPADWAAHCGLVRANETRRGSYEAFKEETE